MPKAWCKKRAVLSAGQLLLPIELAWNVNQTIREADGYAQNLINHNPGFRTA